jgi:hypothetical protein
MKPIEKEELMCITADQDCDGPKSCDECRHSFDFAQIEIDGRDYYCWKIREVVHPTKALTCEHYTYSIGTENVRQQ